MNVIFQVANSGYLSPFGVSLRLNRMNQEFFDFCAISYMTS